MMTAQMLRDLRARMKMNRETFGQLLGRSPRQIAAYELQDDPLPRMVELACVAIRDGATEYV